jgi:hypothetical protein
VLLVCRQLDRELRDFRASNAIVSAGAMAEVSSAAHSGRPCWR